MNAETKRHIDAARQVLVGVVPNPTSQIDQITNALIYKFMDDMDQAAIKQGDEPAFFIGDLERYAWTRLMDARVGNQERMNLYSEALLKFSEAKQLPELFRGIFKSAFLPYRSPEVLGLFLKEIDFFDYSHPEELGNAYEYLLSIMSSQGDAGQFRTPRHIIDFIVDVINPTKDDKVLDPACGTGGFLVSSYKHILEQHDGKDDPEKKEKPLTPDERRHMMSNFEGYDIDPGMVRIAQVNMYLHQFKSPRIFQYDSLSSDERWNDKFDVILANPPFMSPKGGIKPHSKFGIQSSRSEVLFVDYIMSHLRPKGRAGIIVPEGIIFQSGSSHKQLRKNLVEGGLYAVVSLPSGTFAPYSGVKTSILLFNSETAKINEKMLFIDVVDMGIALGATQKTIDKNDLVPALTIIKAFQNGEILEPSKIAFTAAKQDVVSKGYDLSLSKYKKHVSIDMEKPFVSLIDVCAITKGRSSSTKTEPGMFSLYLTAEERKTSDHFDFDGDGVAVPLISATGHGRAAIKRVHYIRGKFALANLLAFLEPNNTRKLNSRYLYHVLDSAKDDMATLMNGAANVSMKTSDLGNFRIPLPSIEIQEQIVEELDGYAGIISGAKQIVTNWKPRIDIDSEWEKVKLGEVCEVESGVGFALDKQGRSTEKYPLLKVSDMNLAGNEMRIEKWNNTVGDSDLKGLGGLPQPVGTIIFPKIGAAISTNKKRILTRPSLYDNNVMGLVPSKKIISEYLYYFLLGFDLSTWASQSALPSIRKSDVETFKIPLPPLEIQKQIVEKIEAERALVESAKKLIAIYEQKTKEVIARLWNEV